MELLYREKKWSEINVTLYYVSEPNFEHVAIYFSLQLCRYFRFSTIVIDGKGRSKFAEFKYKKKR